MYRENQNTNALTPNKGETRERTKENPSLASPLLPSRRLPPFLRPSPPHLGGEPSTIDRMRRSLKDLTDAAGNRFAEETYRKAHGYFV